MTPVSLDVASESRRPTHSRPAAAGRWFYAGVAAVACAVCVAGFAPSILDGSARKGPMTPLVMAHTALAATWIGLYFVQATLVATGRVGAHKTLGTGSAIVAAGVAVTAWRASVAMARRGHDLSGDRSAGPGGAMAQTVFAFGNGVFFGVLVCSALGVQAVVCWRLDRLRGVPTDVWGGSNNAALSGIALNWVLHKATSCNSPIDQAKVPEKAARMVAGVVESKWQWYDLIKNKFHVLRWNDSVHQSVQSIPTRTTTIRPAARCSWTTAVLSSASSRAPDCLPEHADAP